MTEAQGNTPRRYSVYTRGGGMLHMASDGSLYASFQSVNLSGVGEARLYTEVEVFAQALERAYREGFETGFSSAVDGFSDIQKLLMEGENDV